MNPSLLLISGIAWLIVGFIVGNFVAINRLIHNPDFQERLDELREIRYEAERARTLHAVAKMMERVNRNLLLSMIEQFNKDVEAHLKKQKEVKDE